MNNNNNNLKVKIYQSVEVSVAQIATNLAEKDSDAAAEFLNKLSTEITKRCEDESKFDMQLAYIVDDLNEDGKNLILGLVEFIKINEEKA
jgi:hypothetical protein